MGFALLVCAIVAAGALGVRANPRSYVLIALAAVGVGIWMSAQPG